MDMAKRVEGFFLLFVILTCLCGLSAPFEANAQTAQLMQQLLKNGDKAFVQREGFYRVVIPQGFDCEESGRQLKCRSQKSDRALLQIEIRDIPKSGSLELVALNYERRFKKMSHYQLVSKNKLKVDGTPAIVHSMRYDYLGNVQAPVGVQALYMIRQHKLFLIHFECNQNYFAGYMKSLQKLYTTFRPAQLDQGGHPILPNRASPPQKHPPASDKLKPYLKGNKF